MELMMFFEPNLAFFITKLILSTIQNFVNAKNTAIITMLLNQGLDTKNAGPGGDWSAYGGK